jgi:hypothetical protein
MKLLGIISVGFDVTDQMIFRYFAFVRYWRKKDEYNEAVHHLFIDPKKAYDLVRREVLYNILIEVRAPMKLVRFIKMCLNETYSKVPIGIIFMSNQNLIQVEIDRRLNSGKAYHHSVQNILSSRLLSRSVKIRIHKTIILPVVLYDCETWSLTLKEEHKLNIFENRVLRRIFGPKRDEVT